MPKKTFIRTLEFWVPDASGSLLEFGGGLFGECRRFEAATRNLCFGRGEGLPGQAWEAGHPVMLTSLQAPAFRRAAAAQADGLSCAIALPVWVDAQLKSVTVLFCGDDQDHAGAIELWHNDPDEGAGPDTGRGLLRHHRRHVRVPVAQHGLSRGHRSAGTHVGAQGPGLHAGPGARLGLPAR